MNNLPTNVQDMDANQLTAFMSGTTNSSAPENTNELLPLLRINHQEEDDDGNELKKGLFVLDGKGIDKVYSKEVTFRALGDFMQYLHYDQDAQKTINRTIIHRMEDEPIDETGRLRCGRPVGKEFHALPDDQKKKYTGITCFRYLYGLVSYKGETATGETAQVIETPCLFRTKGASFLNFSDEVIKPAKAQNTPFQNVHSTLYNERMRNGGVTYFKSHFKPDFKKTVELSPSDIEVMKHIITLIKGVNDEVRRKYDASLKAIDQSSQDSALVDVVSG